MSIIKSLYVDVNSLISDLLEQITGTKHLHIDIRFDEHFRGIFK